VSFACPAAKPLNVVLFCCPILRRWKDPGSQCRPPRPIPPSPTASRPPRFLQLPRIESVNPTGCDDRRSGSVQEQRDSRALPISGRGTRRNIPATCDSNISTSSTCHAVRLSPAGFRISFWAPSHIPLNPIGSFSTKADLGYLRMDLKMDFLKEASLIVCGQRR
jgi:hypothetical protein